MSIHLFISCLFQKDLRGLIGVDQIVEEWTSISDTGSAKAQKCERARYAWEVVGRSEGR